MFWTWFRFLRNSKLFRKLYLRSSKRQRSVIFVHISYIGGIWCTSSAVNNKDIFLRLRKIYLDLRCSYPWNAEFELRFEDAISWPSSPLSTCPISWPRGACRPGLNNAGLTWPVKGQWNWVISEQPPYCTESVHFLYRQPRDDWSFVPRLHKIGSDSRSDGVGVKKSVNVRRSTLAGNGMNMSGVIIKKT